MTHMNVKYWHNTEKWQNEWLRMIEMHDEMIDDRDEW